MLILIGTLAQTTMDMWEVIDVYFRSWGTLVPLGVFAPESFFPDLPKEGWFRSILDLKFPFPGGKMIGSGMFINLFSAYILMIRRAIRARTVGKGISPRQLFRLRTSSPRQATTQVVFKTSRFWAPTR